MGIFGTSSPFDQDVERATSETNTSEEWGLIMDICDRAGGSSGAARDCLRAVMRRLGHTDPHVQVHAATLLDACVANCGRAFHLEVASRDFETEFRRVLSRAQPAVATRLRAMLRKWADGEFRDDPQLDLIPSLAAKLKAEAGEGGSGTGTGASGTNDAAAAEAAAAAAKRERDELAKAIALSLREASPQQSQTLYPSVEVPAAVTPREVRALYDFEAVEDNELTFKTGETVFVTDCSDPNWWKGYTSRGEGLFPSNFVTSEPAVAPAPAPATEAPERTESVATPAPPPDPVTISEEAMDEALAALHEADPSAPGAAEADIAAKEARALAMGVLVDAALERADTKHARLTQLSAELVDALNLYHELMRAMPPAATATAPPMYGGRGPPPAPDAALYPPFAPRAARAPR